MTNDIEHFIICLLVILGLISVYWWWGCWLGMPEILTWACTHWRKPPLPSKKKSHFPDQSHCCGWTGPYSAYYDYKRYLSHNYQGTLKNSLFTNCGGYMAHPGLPKVVVGPQRERERERVSRPGALLSLESEEGVPRIFQVHSFLVNLKHKRWN